MRLCPHLFLAVALILAGAPKAHGFDMADVSCRAFVLAGRDNIATMITWLLGYHAGKSGIVAASNLAGMHDYGVRLGRYCQEHPRARLIDASEKVLEAEDRGS